MVVAVTGRLGFASKLQAAGIIPFIVQETGSGNKIRKAGLSPEPENFIDEVRIGYEIRESLFKRYGSTCVVSWYRERNAVEWFGARGHPRRPATIDFGGLPSTQGLANRDRLEAATDAGQLEAV
jgi:hypothetical protein